LELQKEAINNVHVKKEENWIVIDKKEVKNNHV
jgi:hypothetical protein